KRGAPQPRSRVACWPGWPIEINGCKATLLAGIATACAHQHRRILLSVRSTESTCAEITPKRAKCFPNRSCETVRRDFSESRWAYFHGQVASAAASAANNSKKSAEISGP